MSQGSGVATPVTWPMITPDAAGDGCHDPRTVLTKAAASPGAESGTSGWLTKTLV